MADQVPTPVTDEQIGWATTLVNGVSGSIKSKTIWTAVAVAVISVGQTYVPTMLATVTSGNVMWTGLGLSAVMVFLRIVTTQALVDKVSK